MNAIGLSTPVATTNSSDAEAVRLLSAEGLQFISDQLRMGRYLQRRRKLFLACGVAIIVIRAIVMICWLLLGLFHSVTYSLVMAAGSIAEIASASFLITIGCKPMRWVASRVFALSLFCAMGNLSAGIGSVYLLSHTGVQNQIIFSWIALSFHVILCMIFTATASYAGYALQCAICCTLPDDDAPDDKAEADVSPAPVGMNLVLPV